MWDLPRFGIKLVSPALQGGFLTTGPRGKPPIFYTSCNALATATRAHSPAQTLLPSHEQSVSVQRTPASLQWSFSYINLLHGFLSSPPSSSRERHPFSWPSHAKPESQQRAGRVWRNEWMIFREGVGIGAWEPGSPDLGASRTWPVARDSRKNGYFDEAPPYRSFVAKSRICRAVCQPHFHPLLGRSMALCYGW